MSQAENTTVQSIFSPAEADLKKKTNLAFLLWRVLQEMFKAMLGSLKNLKTKLWKK